MVLELKTRGGAGLRSACFQEAQDPEKGGFRESQDSGEGSAWFQEPVTQGWARVVGRSVPRGGVHRVPGAGQGGVAHAVLGARAY